MSLPNYQRMMKLIDEVFATRQDPDQLQVTNAQFKKLRQIHPQTLSEFSDANGPLIWVLIIPTTRQVMTDFLAARISETQLLDRTKAGEKYDCIYLCSATTLPEMRGKGKTKEMCLQAINAVRSEHPVTTLFVWPFTEGGNALARIIANESGLELKERVAS
jgi:hypothetical protein